MKVWVCRDADGDYALFPPDADPWLIDEGDDAGEWGDPRGCPSLVEGMCPDSFKAWSGLRKHLQKGTRRKMRWTRPLTDN